MANTQALFPILYEQHGMARMAAESEQVDAGYDVEFRSLAVRSILNRSVSKRLNWMAWSINPYRGCEFACRYCYARYTHEFLAPKDDGEPIRGVLADAERGLSLRDPDAFEKRIFVKDNAAWMLEQDLRRLAKQGRLDEEIGPRHGNRPVAAH